MTKSRLEAFSDGVIAIIITIMVLELRAPHEATFEALRPLIPILLSYILSFIHVGIYWNNHHHLLQAVERVNGPILWANLHLLFWLSMVPFVTDWMGQTSFGTWPVAIYGVVLLMSGVAYYILSLTLVRFHGCESTLGQAVGYDYKGLLSLLFYAVAIPSAMFSRWISGVLYLTVALMWLVPDTRIERNLAASPEQPGEPPSHA